MTSTLLTDFAQTSLDWISQVVRQHDTVLPSEEVTELIFLCSHTASVLDKFWQELRRLLRSGVEARSLALAAKKGIAVADHGLEVIEQVKEFATGEAAGRNSVSLAELAETAQKIKKIRADLQSLLAWLTSPRPQIDASAFRTPAESREGYESLDSIISRLDAGGEL